MNRLGLDLLLFASVVCACLYFFAGIDDALVPARILGFVCLGFGVAYEQRAQP